MRGLGFRAQSEVKSFIGFDKGILRFDQDMASDRQTKSTVKLIAKSTHEDFNGNFAEALVKLQAVDVITDHTKGQIRRTCRAVN